MWPGWDSPLLALLEYSHSDWSHHHTPLQQRTILKHLVKYSPSIDIYIISPSNETSFTDAIVSKLVLELMARNCRNMRKDVG